MQLFLIIPDIVCCNSVKTFNPAIFSAAVPAKATGWISVKAFVVSCVNIWFIIWTGSISFGSSGSKVSKELSSESVGELSKDCESELILGRWLSVGSSNESAEDGDNRLTTVSTEVSFVNCTTISPHCMDQGSLTIPGWRSGKSGHSKDCIRRWCGGCLPEAKVYCLWSSARWASNWCIRVTSYSWCGQFLFVQLRQKEQQNNKKQKRDWICSFSNFCNFCVQYLGPNKNSIQNRHTHTKKTNNK